MNGAVTDQQLLQIVTSAAPSSVDDVLQTMQSIDGLLPGNDGLKWFNLLYLTVTKEVRDHPPASGWAAGTWLPRLDVVFAEFYFGAIAGYLKGGSGTPSSWSAFVRSKIRRRNRPHTIRAGRDECAHQSRLVPGAASD